MEFSIERTLFLQFQGNLLKEYRKDAGIRQLEAALECGLSNQQLISNVERGVSPIPNALLTKLLVLYGRTDEKDIAKLIEAKSTEFSSMLLSGTIDAKIIKLKKLVKC